MAEKTPTRRRWFRFSLRTLFVLMTVAAVWLGFTMKRIRDQERAVARILELGGAVRYDYQVEAVENFNANAEPAGPKWIRRVLGPQWNVRVVHVDLGVEGGGRATDADLKLLKALPGLQGLTLDGNAALTNDGLKLVGQLRNLTTLFIADCPLITDEGLVHLRNLAKLQSVQLVRCNMDGSGLKHVKHLPISYLVLNYTPVIDEHLAAVAFMTELTVLDMQEAAITSRGLVHVKDLTKLWELDLNRTAVDDEGLKHLTGLVKLTHLLLSDTNVTDEGVAKLKASLPNLKSVDR
jgi:hypothetical protein